MLIRANYLIPLSEYLKNGMMKLKSSVIILTVLVAIQCVLAQDAEATQDSPKIIEKEILVTGTATDAENKPIKGVVIYVDSAKTRVKTNRKGEFKMMIKPSSKEVSAYSEFSGMQTMAYAGERQLNFIFPKDFNVISEKELAELGYTIMTPKKAKKEPKDYSKYLDVYQLLVAEFPGVLVSGKTIRLRGTASSSVNSGQEPLIIIDGTQAGSIDFIRPQEIKSIRVIRDESASIYGARGANGVIVIQMKNSG